MAEVTIQYTRDVFGHPEVGSRITVERTDMVDFLLGQGYAVEILASSEDEKGQIGDA